MRCKEMALVARALFRTKLLLRNPKCQRSANFDGRYWEMVISTFPWKWQGAPPIVIMSDKLLPGGISGKSTLQNFLTSFKRGKWQDLRANKRTATESLVYTIRLTTAACNGSPPRRELRPGKLPVYWWTADYKPTKKQPQTSNDCSVRKRLRRDAA